MLPNLILLDLVTIFKSFLVTFSSQKSKFDGLKKKIPFCRIANPPTKSYIRSCFTFLSLGGCCSRRPHPQWASPNRTDTPKSPCRENRSFVRKIWPTRKKNSFYRKKKFQKTDSKTLRQKVSLHRDWLSSHLGGAVLTGVTRSHPRQFGPILLGKTAFY